MTDTERLRAAIRWSRRQHQEVEGTFGRQETYLKVLADAAEKTLPNGPIYRVSATPDMQVKFSTSSLEDAIAGIRVELADGRTVLVEVES